MAEVGNLAVRLSLDNAQFEKSIASMNRTLQAMGQEVRGLQNKGKDWGASLDGLRQKQDAHSRLLEGQQTKVRKLADEYEKAKQETGEHSAQTEKLAVQLNKASAEMNRTETELSQITAELQKQEAEMKRAQSNWNKIGESATAFGDKMKSVGDKMKDVGKELSMKLTAPIAALGVGMVKSAVDFESAFAGVRKTVDTSEEGFAKLEKGILEMARILPASASDIAAVAESAGQLGIAEDNILSFTRTIIDLGESTNMTAEQGATEFARFANIVGMSQQDFDRLGSSIVGLGNTMATTESEIMGMAMRLAAQGSQVGLTESQILALSATMSSLGINAEAGGTAMSMILSKINTAVGKGGKSLDGFAKAAGMTSTEFKKAFETDAAGALDTFIKGLAESSEKGANLTTMLAGLGIKGQYERDTLLRLAGAADLFGGAMETSATAWSENTALSEEAAQRYETTASVLSSLKNRLVEVGIAFGNNLLPYVMQFADIVGPLITKVAELDVKFQMIILAFAGIVAAIGPVLVVGGILASSIGSIAGAFGGMSVAIANAGGVMGALKLAFTSLTGPIGLAIAAIVAIGVAMVAAYKNFDGFRDKVNTVFTAVKDITDKALTSVASFVQEKLKTITTFWNDNGQQIMKATENVFGVIKKVIETIMPAVLVVIDYVWTAIKRVITGALDVIMGVVKTFSALFTGDFKGMWEGIKQIFSGAIDLIIGVLSLSFLGGIRTIFTNLSKTAINLIKTKWTTIAGTFKSFASSIPNTVSGMATSVANLFRNLGTTVVNLIKSMSTSLINTVKELPSKFLQIGKDIMNGLINGIKSLDAIKAISNVVNGIVNTAKSMLGIHSPSRVFKEIGLWTGEGLVIGLDSSSKNVNKAMENIGNGILTVSKSFQKEYSDLLSEHNKKNENKEDQALKKIQDIRNTAAKKKKALTKSQIQEIERLEKSYLDQKSTNKINFDKKYKTLVEKSEKEYFTVIKNYVDDKKSLNKLSVEDEAEIWEQSIELFVEGSKQRIQAQQNYNKAIQAVNKERLEKVEKHIADKKSLDQLSIVDEALIWEKSMNLFAAGTKERIKAQQEYKKATEAVNKEITAINEDFQGQINKVNEELIKQEETLTKAYEDAVDKRAKSLYSFKNLFDEFKVEIDTTGDQLLVNLGTQVEGFKVWQREIEKLSEKAIDKGLLAELREMGPNALPQLIALNNMTSSQLTQYSNLYKEKSKLARTQAETEMIGMKNDTDKQITELRNAANKQLDTLKNEWDTKIKSLTKTTATELSSLKQIGVDAGNGLLQGLASTQGALQKKAQEIANSISKTIQSALKIKSPSRVMMGFGENIGEGLIIGMEDKIKQVVNAGKKLASAVTQPMDSISMGRMNGVSTSIDKSRSYKNGDTHIHVYGNNPSPSEIARRYTQSQRQLAMEWGV
ncbi:phage tail tape measure protein [Solibacillus sp. FSL W8-0474]|uniref:phage tail tape measure protein n=1 Tax=Solibacillus sp. FSL W8-0474 TaxID=2975336 RepID=UPI0030F5A6F9